MNLKGISVDAIVDVCNLAECTAIQWIGKAVLIEHNDSSKNTEIEYEDEFCAKWMYDLICMRKAKLNYQRRLDKAFKTEYLSHKET